MAIFWTFGISLFGIVLIFANKLYELKHRKETFATKLLSRYDKVLERVILRFYFFFKKIEDAMHEKFFVALPQKLRKLRQEVLERLNRLSSRFVDFFRGKREIMPRAKMSKFIASALEYRYHSERERKKLLGNQEE